MRLHKFKFNNPAFNEYLYAQLYNAAVENKYILPPRFLKYARTKSAAKHFIQNASLDEAIFLLSHLGIEHFLVFADRDTLSVKNLKDILKNYQQAQKVGALEQIIQAKIFVSSDKEFNDLLGMMAQTIHHKTYTLNLEYTKVGHHLHQLPRHLNHSEDGPTIEAQENFALVCKTVLNSSLLMNKVDFLFRLKPHELQVLLYLYPIKHTYVTPEQIQEKFSPYYRKKLITTTLKNLVQSGHIRRSVILKDPAYSIAGTGIRVITDFLIAILKQNDFR